MYTIHVFLADQTFTKSDGPLPIQARKPYRLPQYLKTSTLFQMLSNVLYSKRFFPYSVSNVLAGLDEDGEGWVYSYDPVGCVEKLKNSSGGAGVAIIQPLLDNQVNNLLRQMSATRSKYHFPKLFVRERFWLR